MQFVGSRSGSLPGQVVGECLCRFAWITIHRSHQLSTV